MYLIVSSVRNAYALEAWQRGQIPTANELHIRKTSIFPHDISDGALGGNILISFSMKWRYDILCNEF